MALWKPFRGSRADLDSVPKHDGYVYFCVDDGTLFFDYANTDGILQRKQISAKDAESLSGLSLDEIKTSLKNYVDETIDFDFIKPGEGLHSVVLNNTTNIASGEYSIAEG